MLHFQSCANKTELDVFLAQHIAAAISRAITTRGQAAVALSGGRTPQGMLIQLSRIPLSWEKVLIVLVDERWVNENHPDSNARFLRETLLVGSARAATFLSLKNAATTPHAGQAQCETLLSILPEHLDISVLGMGDDGHTASLFPQAPELESALHSQYRSAAISPQTAPHLRMTLTAPYIAQSREVILHITGLSKKGLLQQSIAKGAPQPYAPIRRVLDLIRTEKYVFWAE